MNARLIFKVRSIHTGSCFVQTVGSYIDIDLFDQKNRSIDEAIRKFLNEVESEYGQFYHNHLVMDCGGLYLGYNDGHLKIGSEFHVITLDKLIQFNEEKRLKLNGCDPDVINFQGHSWICPVIEWLRDNKLGRFEKKIFEFEFGDSIHVSRMDKAEVENLISEHPIDTWTVMSYSKLLTQRYGWVVEMKNGYYKLEI